MHNASYPMSGLAVSGIRFASPQRDTNSFRMTLKAVQAILLTTMATASSNTETEVDSAEARSPQCTGCGAPLKPFDPKTTSYGRWNRPTSNNRNKPLPEATADGEPPKWGTRGDNLACNYVCAHKVLMRVIASVPDVIDLLPPHWRPDLLPPEESPKVRKAREASARSAAANKRWRDQRKAQEAKRLAEITKQELLSEKHTAAAVEAWAKKNGVKLVKDTAAAKSGNTKAKTKK